jgi:hypothetical protein
LRRVVRTLGACLRMAESLDRSRHGVVRGVDLRTTGAEAILRLEAAGDVELEAWAAQRQREPLEAVLGMPFGSRSSMQEERPPAAPARPCETGAACGGPVNTELTRRKLD